jgi:hypothetical protein
MRFQGLFLKETKGGRKVFDWRGAILFGLGLFALIFALALGPTYGWTTPVKDFAIGDWTWPAANISVIPFALWVAAVCLALFAVAAYFEEKDRRAHEFSWGDIPEDDVDLKFRDTPRTKR